MRVLITGASGVLGRSLAPRLQAAGHDLRTPGPEELDLFEASAVDSAVDGCDAVVHLASHVPAPELRNDPDAWTLNDRLRSIATKLLVDALLRASGSEVFILPSVAMLYQTRPAQTSPDQTRPADEQTPIGDVPAHLRSAVVAEQHAQRATDHGKLGVVLRLGRLYGPGTGVLTPDATANATLHVADAGAALHVALTAPARLYNVCDDGGPISNERFKADTGWRPTGGA